jgi:hypothetical protein
VTKAQDTITRALHAIEHAAGHMSAADVAVAEAQLTDVEYRPLTKELIEAATALRELVEERYGIATAEHAGVVGGDVVQLNGDGVSRQAPVEEPG